MYPNVRKTPANFPGAPTSASDYGETVVTARSPGSASLVINSADRLYTSSSIKPTTSGDYNSTWNNFIVQKPAPLMESFARRITPTEIRFPWCVPNINKYTNSFYIDANLSGNPTLCVLPVGFYTPSELESEIQDLLDAAFPTPADAPTITWEAAEFQFKWTCGNQPFALKPYLPFNILLDTTKAAYESEPSLLKLLGVPSTVLGPLALLNAGDTFTGDTTFCQYTDYIDIVSDKLNYNTDVRDGYSGVKTQPSLMIRLYIADEVSVTQTVPTGCRPFLIHRQFKNAKSIKWNPDSMVDWLDIKVLDQYGNLVALVDGPDAAYKHKQYPNFQITLIASEN